MKKIIAAILVLVLSLLCLAGCGGEDVSSTDTSSEITSSDIVSSDENTSSEDVSSGDASSGEENSSEEESSKPTSSTTQTAPTNYSKFIITFTEFSDTYPLNIDSVVSSMVRDYETDSEYCVEYDKENEYPMWEKYKIPEADFLRDLRKKYVITDEFFAKIKQQGTYYTDTPDSCEYKDGYFNIELINGWGGEMGETFYLKKTIDDKAGTITLYYQYFVEGEEQHDIEVVYTYSGSASYEIETPSDHYFAGYFKSENKAFIDSLRLKSIKKVQP